MTTHPIRSGDRVAPEPPPGFTVGMECIRCGHMSTYLAVHIATGICTRCAPANAIGRRSQCHATATW